MNNIHTVKLGNGKEVSWEEFSGWSSIKQYHNLRSLEEVEKSRAKRKDTWLSKDRSLTEEHKQKLRSIKRTEEFKAKLRGRKAPEEVRAKLRGRKVPEEVRAKLRGRKVPAETLAKRKATRAITLQWHTPNGSFPNKMAIYLKVRKDMGIPHLKAIELVDGWIRDFPESYYRGNKKLT